MDKINKKVSIIIPTYMRETKYLSRAINSVLSQTYKNIEIIVVDDNHPNSDYRIQIKMLMKQFEDFSNVIYIENPKNMGGSLARNNGINAATGDYISFLDDDDEYLPKKVENQLRFMIDDNCDMSFTNLKLVNEKWVVVDYREYHNLKSFDKMTLLKYHIMRSLTGTPTFMYKAEKLREIGGFKDAKIGQEFFLMLKSIERDLKIRYIDDCNTIAYRHSSGGISQGRNKINGEKAMFDFKKKYFPIFTTREKMFIRFRHYAVMTIAYKRNKNYFRAFLSGVTTFMISPLDFFGEVGKFVWKVFKNRKFDG